MKVRFCKMHGSGNDFVVVNAIAQKIALSKKQICHMGDRHFGIGFDQLLLVESTPDKQADFGYRIYNPDGSEAETCGNGARCLGLFIRRENLSFKNCLKFKTISGMLSLEIFSEHEVRVNMGIPKEMDALDRTPAWTLAHETLEGQLVTLGNPHCLLSVSGLSNFSLSDWAQMIVKDSLFPNGINVGAMEIIDASHIRLRVYERGAGETLACGSGACAAVVAGRLSEQLHETVQVEQPGGTLTVQWAGPHRPVFLTGPAIHVFSGEIDV